MTKEKQHPADYLRTLPADILLKQWRLLTPATAKALAARAEKLNRTLTRAIHQLHHAEKLKTAAQSDAARYLFERNELLGIIQQHGLTAEIKSEQLANTAELDLRPQAIKRRAVKNAQKAGIAVSEKKTAKAPIARKKATTKKAVK